MINNLGVATINNYPRWFVLHHEHHRGLLYGVQTMNSLISKKSDLIRYPWMYKGKPFTKDMIPPGAYGFLYLTIDKDDMYYVGRKKFDKRKTWFQYDGSGDRVLSKKKKHGNLGIRRYMLMIFDTFEELQEAEGHLLTSLDAKNNSKFYNLTNCAYGIKFHSPEGTESIVKASTGRKHSEETKRKIGDAHRGKIVSEETRKKLSENQKGKKASQETKDKLSKIHTGKKLSAETRKKMGDAKRGIPKTEEHKQKLREANTGKKHSAAHCKKISEGNKGKIVSEETRKKLSENQKGKKHTEATKQKLREINLGKKLSVETRRKMSESHKRRNT